MLRRAAVAPTVAPIRPDPVKLTAQTSGSPISAGPTASPEPNNTLTTPAGIPAANAHSANTIAARDDDSAGLSTIVLPNANAGPAFQSGIATGKFHGVISATTPSGCRRVNCSAPAACAGITSPIERTASPA